MQPHFVYSCGKNVGKPLGTRWSPILNTKQPALHSPIIRHLFPLQPQSHYFCRWIKASEEVVREFSALSQRLLSSQSLLAFLFNTCRCKPSILVTLSPEFGDHTANGRLKAFLAAYAPYLRFVPVLFIGSTATVMIQHQTDFGSGILIIKN